MTSIPPIPPNPFAQHVNTEQASALVANGLQKLGLGSLLKIVSPMAITMLALTYLPQVFNWVGQWFKDMSQSVMQRQSGESTQRITDLEQRLERLQQQVDAMTTSAPVNVEESSVSEPKFSGARATLMPPNHPVSRVTGMEAYGKTVSVVHPLNSQGPLSI